MHKILISACLVGLNTRFNGGNKKDENLARLSKQSHVVFTCPEQLGGLPTPREPAEIEFGKSARDVFEGNGKVFSISGIDQTKEYLNAANKTLAFCKENGVSIAILKLKSPSCGSQKIYDGSFTGNVIDGEGLVTYLLEKNNIKVYNEDNYPKELLKLP